MIVLVFWHATQVNDVMACLMVVCSYIAMYLTHKRCVQGGHLRGSDFASFAPGAGGLPL